jgi:predicted Zn-dependent protease
MNKAMRAILSGATALWLAAPGMAVFADDKDKDKNKDKAAASKSKLSEKENPELIGKRNINKGSIQFYGKEREAALGAGYSAELDRQLKFVTDPVVTEYINRVGQNIAMNSDAKVPFTIKVVDSPEVNAFALPGGFFYVNKGLILAAENESEVACVMAHEIAHVAARHGTEQASKGQLANYASIGLIFVPGGVGILAANAANILVPLSFLKFSRGAEFEADMLGAQYAWASGYDPGAFITFFEKLKAQESKNPNAKIPTVFATHPPNDERIAKVRQLVALFPVRDEYVVNTSEFSRVKARLGVVAPDVNRRLGGPGGGSDNGGRPTLKRRGNDPQTQTDDPQDDAKPGTSTDSQDPKGRPTLKRRTENGSDAPSDSPNNP